MQYDEFGNAYTDHAARTMMPSGHRYTDGGVIHYPEEGRGIPAMVVQDVLTHATPTRKYENGEWRLVYDYNGVRVVKSEADNVIVTLMKKY